MKVDQTSEDGGECGNEVICKVTSMYFDCTIDLRCEQCEEIFIVHHSEPGKCKNSADQREDGQAESSAKESQKEVKKGRQVNIWP